MVTAITSLLTGRPVRPYLAMSGEVTLRGKVLPVGGVRRRSSPPASRSKTVILPAKNEKDLVDVPKRLREDIDVRFVTHVDEVLNIALEPA